MSLLLPWAGTVPVIDPRGWVAPNAAVIGDVTLGPDSGIWFGTTVRGDVMPIRIGARTSIQDNSVLHTSHDWTPTLVGDDVTVGHGVILHGCSVSDRVLVGMGSIVMDAVEIGADVILGAGSLVTPETRIPPGVLAHGRPARVVRDLRPDELARILEASATYVAQTAAYRDRPTP